MRWLWTVAVVVLFGGLIGKGEDMVHANFPRRHAVQGHARASFGDLPRTLHKEASSPSSVHTSSAPQPFRRRGLLWSRQPRPAGSRLRLRLEHRAPAVVPGDAAAAVDQGKATPRDQPAPLTVSSTRHSDQALLQVLDAQQQRQAKPRSNRKLKVGVIEMKSSVIEKFANRRGLAAMIAQNIVAVDGLVAKAKARGAELVVVPEYALVNYDYFDPRHLGDFKTMGRFIATMARFVPGAYRYHCSSPSQLNKDPSRYQLWDVSCIARKHGVFLVVNVMTPARWGRFRLPFFARNSNLIFSPTGRLVHKYDKRYSVASELHIQDARAWGVWRPQQNEAPRAMVGAAIANMVCFDLIFPDSGYFSYPDMALFTTAWTSKGPLISVGAQQAFSRATRSVLLASNLNYAYEPGDSMRHTGSGIYQKGKPLDFHFGHCSPKGASGAEGVVLVQEVDLDAPTDFWLDNVDVRECPYRHSHARDTKIVVLRAAELKQNKGVLAVDLASADGNLQCYLRAQVDVDSVGTNDMFIFQMYLGQFPKPGKKKGRQIRTCQFFVAHSENPHKWNVFDIPSSTKFKYIRVTGNPGGSNVALLPITVCQQQQGGVQVPAPLSPGRPGEVVGPEHSAPVSKWVFSQPPSKAAGTAQPHEFTTLSVEGVDMPLLSVAQYGVVDTTVEAPAPAGEGPSPNAAQRFTETTVRSQTSAGVVQTARSGEQGDDGLPPFESPDQKVNDGFARQQAHSQQAGAEQLQPIPPAAYVKEELVSDSEEQAPVKAVVQMNKIRLRTLAEFGYALEKGSTVQKIMDYGLATTTRDTVNNLKSKGLAWNSPVEEVQVTPDMKTSVDKYIDWMEKNFVAMKYDTQQRPLRAVALSDGGGTDFVLVKLAMLQRKPGADVGVEYILGGDFEEMPQYEEKTVAMAKQLGIDDLNKQWSRHVLNNQDIAKSLAKALNGREKPNFIVGRNTICVCGKPAMTCGGVEHMKDQCETSSYFGFFQGLLQSMAPQGTIILTGSPIQQPRHRAAVHKQLDAALAKLHEEWGDRVLAEKGDWPLGFEYPQMNKWLNGVRLYAKQGMHDLGSPDATFVIITKRGDGSSPAD